MKGKSLRQAMVLLENIILNWNVLSGTKTYYKQMQIKDVKSLITFYNIEFLFFVLMTKVLEYLFSPRPYTQVQCLRERQHPAR